MSRFTQWYNETGDGEEDSAQGWASEQSNEPAYIRHPEQKDVGNDHSHAVMVSAEDALVGITERAWTWLMEQVRTDDEGLTKLMAEHNRLAPRARVSSHTSDHGAADLLAWLVAAQERLNGNEQRVALIPSAIAQALNDRDMARMGKPPVRKRHSS